MTMMISRRLNREEFVNWIADSSNGYPTLPLHTGRGESKSTDVTLVWPEHQSNARPIVCVAEQQFQEFFAFVSTYNTSVRPYTAYFRVIPLELAGILENTGRERRNEMRLAKMIAGASIAETWVSAARQGERLGNVILFLQSSLSSALGQVVLEGYGEPVLNWVLQEWLGARMGQPDLIRAHYSKGSEQAWRHILSATTLSRRDLDSSAKVIAAFMANAIEAESLRPAMLRPLSELTHPEIDLGKLLAASREERISRFNATLSDLKRRSEGGLQAEFLAGLMLAIAGNGSLDMLRSTREFDGWLDGAATWFGLCAALFQESNVLSYANSAGRRIVRDLMRRDDPFGLPSADIASTELKFLQSSLSSTVLLGAHAPEINRSRNSAKRCNSSPVPRGQPIGQECRGTRITSADAK